MDLTGKTALVTGAGSGLGEASAHKLASLGARVALLGRTKSELDEVAQGIVTAGGQAQVLVADIGDEPQMQAAFRQLTESFGTLDIVFANAGVNGTWAPIDELTYADWSETMRINLGGTFLTTHLAVPLMKAKGGSIIITASINGTRTFSNGGASAYATSKAGQVGYAQMLALELAPHRIRVNVVCPGAIESEISDNTDDSASARARYPAEYPHGKVPLTGGKPGKAEDVAELVAFLASDAAKHITGTPIWIDGAESLLV
jgi:NAD(P)-dependent dehydrogenase (short-subunit alcohol dehydrogenase family)